MRLGSAYGLSMRAVRRVGGEVPRILRGSSQRAGTCLTHAKFEVGLIWEVALSLPPQRERCLEGGKTRLFVLLLFFSVEWSWFF